MSKIVLTFSPTGTVETLLKDKQFDSRVFGSDRKIERLSEVLPTDDGQAFFIRWLKGPRSSSNFPTEDRIAPPGTAVDELRRRSLAAGGYELTPEGQTMYFDTYEDAVAHEVAEVNRMRLEGHSFQ